jgi:hypothetical protein
MLWWLLYIAFDIAVNYYVIEIRKTRPHYGHLRVMRGGASIIHASLIMQVISLQEYGPILLFHLTSFWSLFDPILNKLRKKLLTYRGKNSGWIDRLPEEVYWPAKVIVLIIFLFQLFLILRQLWA